MRKQIAKWLRMLADKIDPITFTVDGAILDALMCGTGITRIEPGKFFKEK